MFQAEIDQIPPTLSSAWAGFIRVVSHERIKETHGRKLEICPISLLVYLNFRVMPTHFVIPVPN